MSYVLNDGDIVQRNVISAKNKIKNAKNLKFPSASIYPTCTFNQPTDSQ